MAEEHPEQAPPEAPSAAWQGAKRVLILVAIQVGVVGAAWGVGRMQGQARVWDANKLTAAAEASASSARQATSAEAQKVLALEARRRVHLADVEIERRNFGSANEHLQAAAKLLARGATPGSELAKLADEVRATSVIASADAAEAHKKVTEIARRFDAIIPPITP